MRVLVLQNLRAGVSDGSVYDFVHALGRRGAEVVMRFMTEENSVEELLADAEKFDRVVAAGGDGTVSAAAYILRGSGVPLLAYPAGTANLLAMNVRMPSDPVELARATLGGRIVPVDLGEIVLPRHPCAEDKATGFVMIAGAGFDARIMEGAQPYKSTLGAGAYIVSALQNLAPTVSSFRLDLDGEIVETEGIAVLVVNFGRIQFDIAVTHESDAQDGMFEVVVLRTKTAIGLLPAISAALIDRLGGNYPDRSPSLEIHTARHIRIEADPPLPVQYDGEIFGGVTPLEARVLPGAGTLIVPDTAADSEGRLVWTA